ncbi:MAG: polysaccharide biosynthesis protein [Peptococcaceae bacterium]|jgi:FlaA1/EpsC-like NDP-sugar epimerase|nr:polysaccharide biosynthesis protein [Peptococcaceae bacterium]
MKNKQWIYILADGILSGLAIYAAVFLRFEGKISPDYRQYLLVYYPLAAVVTILAGYFWGTYRTVLQYIGFADAFRQIGAAGVSAAVFLFVKYTGLYPVSGSITVIYFGILLIFTTGIRLIPRFVHWYDARRSNGLRRAMIIGAGATGAMVIKRLEENGEEGLYPVVAIDDDPAKTGMRVAGVYVAGGLDAIPAAAARFAVEEAILAIPSIDAETITSIYHCCADSGVKLRVFQSTVDMESYLAGDRKALRHVSLEDLLFRDSVRLDQELIARCLRGKTVLVTGGAGSIGREICRQALANACRRLVIFDFDENGLFSINEELKKQYPAERYQLCLGSIRDQERLDDVFRRYRPEIVFHAAAHKHVPMMEANPFEAVKNNIFGTERVLRCCLAWKTERCILISSDKAVNPASAMGATKRVAELLSQCLNGKGCKMAAVRFGNVLGSQGSVVPTFKKQIEAGGPVTVTHRDMERYFITIPEAVSLILIAGTLAEGGEIFALDMGKPVKIDALARELIRLSGLEPGKDISIEYIGIRPGEKIAEEISWAAEKVSRTTQEKLFVMKSGADFDQERFMADLEAIRRLSLTEGEEEVAPAAGSEALLRRALMAIAGSESPGGL